MSTEFHTLKTAKNAPLALRRMETMFLVTWVTFVTCAGARTGRICEFQLVDKDVSLGRHLLTTAIMVGVQMYFVRNGPSLNPTWKGNLNPSGVDLSFSLSHSCVVLKHHHGHLQTVATILNHFRCGRSLTPPPLTIGAANTSLGSTIKQKLPCFICPNPLPPPVSLTH